jgi:hypothetical protein
MICRNPKWLVAGFAFVCLAAVSQVGRAEPIAAIGTPAVQQDLDPADPEKGFFASVTNISPAVDQALSDTPVELDVMFTDMQHLEIFDADAGDFGGMEAGFEDMAMDISVSNTSSTEAGEVNITLDFLDMSGNVITPAALDSDDFGNHASFTLDPDSGLIGFSRIFRAELMNGLQFHGIRIGLTGAPQLFWNDLSVVEIRKIDTTSHVGVWVPEPSTSALLLIAAIATGVRFKRKS